MKYLNYLLVFLSVLSQLNSQKKSEHNAIKADKYYRDSNFVEAEEYYRKAQVENKDFKSQYNLGNCLYQQNRFDEAKSVYEKLALDINAVQSQKADAYYNLGNAQMKKNNFKDAVNSYKEALKRNPSDQEYKKNLSKALQLKKIEQKQKEQEQKEQENNNQENPKDQKNPENQNSNQDQNSKQNEKDKKNQAQENESQDDPKNKQNNQASDNPEQDLKGSKSDPNKLSKEEAEQILNMVNAKDKKAKEKLQKRSSRRIPKSKDW